MRVAIVSGTVFGTSEEVALRAHEILQEAGLDVTYQKSWSLAELLEYNPEALLFVASTTGMGELPEKTQALVSEMEARHPDWAGRPAGIIGLGDSAYGDTFCQGATDLEELAELLGLVQLQETLRLDGSETVTPEQDAVPWVETFAVLLKDWNA